MSEELKKKKVNPRRLQGTTNFYPTYVDGNKDHIVKDKDLAPYLEDIIRKKVKYGSI